MNANKLHIDTADEPTYTIDTRRHLKDLVTPKRIGGASLLLATGLTAGFVRGEISAHTAPENEPITHTITVQEGQTLWGVATQIERGEVENNPEAQGADHSVANLDPAEVQKTVNQLRMENNLNSPELGTGQKLTLKDSEYTNYLSGTQESPSE